MVKPLPLNIAAPNPTTIDEILSAIVQYAYTQKTLPPEEPPAIRHISFEWDRDAEQTWAHLHMVNGDIVYVGIPYKRVKLGMKVLREGICVNGSIHRGPYSIGRFFCALDTQDPENFVFSQDSMEPSGEPPLKE